MHERYFASFLSLGLDFVGLKPDYLMNYKSNQLIKGVDGELVLHSDSASNRGLPHL